MGGRKAALFHRNGNTTPAPQITFNVWTGGNSCSPGNSEPPRAEILMLMKYMVRIHGILSLYMLRNSPFTPLSNEHLYLHDHVYHKNMWVEEWTENDFLFLAHETCPISPAKRCRTPGSSPEPPTLEAAPARPRDEGCADVDSPDGGAPTCTSRSAFPGGDPKILREGNSPASRDNAPAPSAPSLAEGGQKPLTWLKTSSRYGGSQDESSTPELPGVTECGLISPPNLSTEIHHFSSLVLAHVCV